MKEKNRVTPEGEELGRQLVRLTEPTIKMLEEQDEPDERCKTCAFRLGTVPNGCPQTQLDALKAVLEGIPFMCHQSTKLENGSFSDTCHGWYAGRVALKGKITKTFWPFSPEEPSDKKFVCTLGYPELLEEK